MARKGWLACSVGGVLLGPLAGLGDGSVFVTLPVVSHGFVKGVVAVGGRHKGLDGEEDLNIRNARAVLENQTLTCFGL